MRGLVIRPMRLEDLPAVTAVDRLAFAAPWSPNTFSEEVRQPTGYYLVAEVEGRLIGYIGAWMVVDEAHITTLGVHPEYRRRHVAEELLRSLLWEARLRQVRRVTLEVRASNLAAQNLYHKFGFETLGTRRGYYTDNGEDALLMGLTDLSRAFTSSERERAHAGPRY